MAVNQKNAVPGIEPIGGIDKQRAIVVAVAEIVVVEIEFVVILDDRIIHILSCAQPANHVRIPGIQFLKVRMNRQFLFGRHGGHLFSLGIGARRDQIQDRSGVRSPVQLLQFVLRILCAEELQGLLPEHRKQGEHCHNGSRQHHRPHSGIPAGRLSPMTAISPSLHMFSPIFILKARQDFSCPASGFPYANSLRLIT